MKLVPPATLDARIEGAQTTDGRHLILTGWAEDAAAGQLVLHDAANPSAAVPLDPVYVPREDVAEALARQGRGSAGMRHGFVAVIAGPAPASLRLELKRSNRSDWSEVMTLRPETVSFQVILAVADKAGRQSGDGPVHALARLADRFVLDDPRPPRVARVCRFEPTQAAALPAPRVSIVIPFYGDGFYVLDHLMAQRRAPADVEWIFVCDDPRLADGFDRSFERRRSLVHQPTTVVFLESNSGFAQANNVGAAHARGEFLLLMNSDVYCRQFDFLDYATGLMRQEPSVGCVGFSMQFEDGTIQHDGMQFERRAWFDNLWLSEHPGKGLPCRWDSLSHHEVDAVTAALMLLRRGELESDRVFDPGYVSGDFEDGDLCLRVRERGQRVMLVRAPGLYHLERQSVRHIGDSPIREAVTRLNCLRFNARWGARLAAAAGERA